MKGTNVLNWKHYDEGKAYPLVKKEPKYNKYHLLDEKPQALISLIWLIWSRACGNN